MAEVRTTSATGGQKGVKPERFGLIPTKGLEAIARVFGFGAQKYADHNWRRGYEWSKSIDALQRHVEAFKDGQTYDEESGLPHLAHAGFHVLVLLTWLEDQGEGSGNAYDDRWPATMARARLEAEQEYAEIEESLADFHVPPPEPPADADQDYDCPTGYGPDLRRKRRVQIHDDLLPRAPFTVDRGGQVVAPGDLFIFNQGVEPDPFEFGKTLAEEIRRAYRARRAARLDV